MSELGGDFLLRGFMKVTVITNLTNGEQLVSHDFANFKDVKSHIKIRVGNRQNIDNFIVVNSNGEVSKLDAKGEPVGFMKME